MAPPTTSNAPRRVRPEDAASHVTVRVVLCGITSLVGGCFVAC